MYLTDMCSVLDSFNAYVPLEESTNCIEVAGDLYFYDDTKLIQLLLFGDQLTAAEPEVHQNYVIPRPKPRMPSKDVFQ